MGVGGVTHKKNTSAHKIKKKKGFQKNSFNT